MMHELRTDQARAGHCRGTAGCRLPDAAGAVAGARGGHHPGSQVGQRHHRLAGRGLFGSDHLDALRLSRRRHAGSRRQGRAGQSDDRAVRRGRRRSRQRRLPEPARRCRRRNALRRAAATRIYGSMRMLADQKDEALELLRLAIEQPRFDQAPIDRIRGQIVSGIRRQRPRSRDRRRSSPGRRRSMATIPIPGRTKAPKQTLATITADDLQGAASPAVSRATI